jgi:hypothetical protein
VVTGPPVRRSELFEQRIRQILQTDVDGRFAAELRAVEHLIAKNPTAAVEVPGTNGLRAVKTAPVPFAPRWVFFFLIDADGGCTLHRVLPTEDREAS